jgi:DnaK suppressor protein
VPSTPARRDRTGEAATKATRPARAGQGAKAGRTAAPGSEAGRAGEAPAGPGAAPQTLAAQLVVRPDEQPWTEQELEEVRDQLQEELTRLAEGIADAESDIADLLRDTGDGAGEDQADAGAKTFEREHEMSLAANARDMYEQTARALHRIQTGTYGVCEACGNPIGKRRLQAFPRATLCLACKQRQERR